MVDHLLGSRKTTYSGPIQDDIQTRSEEEHGSTISNSQNGESSSRGQKRRSREVFAGRMNLGRREH